MDILIHNPDKRLEWLLEVISEIAGADLACIHTYNKDSDQLDLVAIQTFESLTQNEWDLLVQQIHNHLRASSPCGSAVEISFDHTRQLFIWKLMAWRDVIGGVSVLSKNSPPLTQAQVDRIDVRVKLAQTILENAHLTERLITTEAIARSAAAIARNPTPQNIVDVLRDHLFDIHITHCALCLYGPMQYGNQPNEPFEYLEIKGSWSSTLGRQVGLGRRFPLKLYQPLFDRLDQQKVLILDTDEFSLLSDDPLIRDIIRSDRIQTAAIIALESEERKLGLLSITSDERHAFTPYEIRAYQIVSEFLTMTTLASALRQEADYVQQGRAALLDAVTDGVIMVLPNRDSTVLTVNQHFTTMFGVSEREAYGVPLDRLLDQMRIPTVVRRELRDQWQSHPIDGKLHGEFRMPRQPGSSADIQWYCAPVYQNQQVIGRIYTFHDITPERTAERLRSELLSRISHELRTPLTSIRGFAEFILEAEGDQLPPLAREYTEIILNSARHLNVLFTDMIEITRANAGQVKLRLRHALLQDVIIETVARMEVQFKDRHQSVVMDIDDDLPAVQIDVDRLSQVLTNIISNAIKYSPQHSQIRILTHLAQTTDDLPRSAPPDMTTPCIVVTVVDEGQGLTRQEADKVFLPFYRAKKVLSQPIEGSGLGLAIAHSIVELHGGKIWAEAATKHRPGGRFLFTIPTS